MEICAQRLKSRLTSILLKSNKVNITRKLQLEYYCGENHISTLTLESKDEDMLDG